MIKTLSLAWPWDVKYYPDAIIDHALDLGANELCLRTPVYGTPYGDHTLPYYQGMNLNANTDNVAIEKAAKAAGLKVSLWPVILLYNWAGEAQAIKNEVIRYNPDRVFLDAEGNIKNHIANLGAFLNSQGKLKCPTHLQSYRRADLHPEMQWSKWYSYKDQTTGEYIINGVAPQMYPIGKVTVAGWLDDFKKSVDSHEAILSTLGRVPAWFPTLPTFISGSFEGDVGWVAPVDCLLAGIEYLKNRLGDRLVGINFWALDRHLANPALKALFDAVASIPSEPADPPPVPEYPPIEEGYPILVDDARARGVAI